MDERLREAIGRASYEAALGDDMVLPWDKLSEDAKEVNRKSAEKVVEAFLAPFLPAITTLAQELIRNNPGMEDMMREVWKQAIGKEIEA
jgi:hypothetical protein